MAFRKKSGSPTSCGTRWKSSAPKRTCASSISSRPATLGRGSNISLRPGRDGAECDSSDEIRMTNDETMTKPECRRAHLSVFGFHHSFVIRHSDFVIYLKR